MKILYNGKEYRVSTEDNQLTAALGELLPLKLRMTRSDEHEYYAALPKNVSADGAKSTSHVKAGWLYYFKEWNAFALNFREKEIAPYSVYVIGKAQGGIENILAGSGANIEIEIR